MNELPPLPEPGYSGLREDYFTEEQMRAYAAAAVAAEREACAQIAYSEPRVWDTDAPDPQNRIYAKIRARGNA